MNEEDGQAMTAAIADLAQYWPMLLVAKDGGDNEETDRVVGIAMYATVEDAVKLRAALDESIKGMMS